MKIYVSLLVMVVNGYIAFDQVVVWFTVLV